MTDFQVCVIALVIILGFESLLKISANISRAIVAKHCDCKNEKD